MSLDSSYSVKEIREICKINASSYSKNDNWDFFNYLDTKNITKGEINEIKYLDPTIEKIPSRAKRKVNINDIIISTVRPNQEHYGIIKYETENFLVSTGFTTLTVDKTVAIPEFIYYYITQNHITNSLQTIAEQSTTSYPSIKPSDIGDLIINLPPLNIQKRISNILSSIENKIEINIRINKNLEQLMKCLFEEWFVNFNYSDNLSFKSSELGEIPEFWNVKTLGDILDILESGKRPKGGISEIDYGIPSVGAENILGLGKFDYSKNKLISHEFFNKLKKGIIQDQDVLLYKDGAQLGRKSLFMNGFPFDICCINEHVFRLQSNNEISQFYLYLWLDQEIMTNEIINLNSNSAQPGINQNDVKSLPILVPEVEVMNKFTNIVSPMMNNLFDNALEVKKLSSLRDTLLPKLMSGEIDVSKINYDILKTSRKNWDNEFTLTLQNNLIEVTFMKTKIISKIQNQMKPYLNQGQYIKLTNTLLNSLQDIDVIDNNNEMSEVDNFKLLDLFLSAKQVEGCSDKTIIYYKSTIEKMLIKIKKQVYNINTDDLRKYLFDHKNEKHSSKTTIDNIRRIFSSFFSWLEDEDYILKNPVRRIHRVKTGRVVKEVLTDENVEVLRDNCEEIRDLAMVELLTSTGIRVGELVRLNIEDIDFYERECVVFGKGESERVVYFDARTKIHLIEYLQSRIDDNPALFVSLNSPYERLGISGVETRLRELGKKCNINKVHPHKFRRTMATNAIDKGMPIEQVQKLLGHVQIDTTMQYALVNQSNVKLAHRKFIG